MNQKGIVGLLVLLLVLVFAGSASAFGVQFFRGDLETREKIVEALEARDYNAWKEALSAQLTEETFNMQVERYEAFTERQARRVAMEQALEKGDYEAWKAAMDNCHIPSDMIVDKDNFTLLVQLHQAREGGDYETVRELREQLGLPQNRPNRLDRHNMFGHFKRGRMI